MVLHIARSGVEYSERMLRLLKYISAFLQLLWLYLLLCCNCGPIVAMVTGTYFVSSTSIIVISY